MECWNTKGRLEYWNDGILGGRIILKLNPESLKLFVFNHYSSFPLFQYSDKYPLTMILIEINGYERV
jgi:hypothetical protein